jgi:hypothetical protein
VNFSAFERAQVAAFAYREARRTGALDCMRAVCYILRNRVKSAWGDGTWLSVIVASHLSAAGFEPFVMGEIAPNAMPTDTGAGALISGFRSDDRLLQLIVRDVDDIYLGQESFDDRVRQVVCGEQGLSSSKKDWKPALYYSFVDREPRPWFVENIIRRAEHPQVGQIGTMMLYR